MRYRVLLKSGRCWHTDFERGPNIWDHPGANELFATVVAREDGDDTPVYVYIEPSAVESITDMDCG